MSEARADVVVIGGGVRGCACAYYLAKAGVAVTLLEKEGIASGASSCAFAQVNVSHKDPAYYAALSLESARLFDGLEDELGEPFGYRPGGSLGPLAEMEQQIPAMQAYIGRQNRVPGLQLEYLPGDELRALEPALSTHVLGGCFCAQDAHINPYLLTVAFSRAARRLGATIMTGTRATGIERENERVQAVVTDRGRIATRTAVVAAGIDMPEVGRMIGVTIPVVPSRGQVITTERTRPLLRWPLATVRQTEDGSVLIGMTNEFIGRDRGVRYDDAARNARRALEVFPVLRDLQVVRLWSGLRPFTVDGLPILGPVAHLPSVVLATGHSGVTLAPVTGTVVRDLVTKGSTAVDITECTVERYSSVRYNFAMHAYRRSQPPARPVQG